MPPAPPGGQARGARPFVCRDPERGLARNQANCGACLRQPVDPTWASPQWEAFTGQSQEQAIGKGWMDAVHPDDREAAAVAERGDAGRAAGWMTSCPTTWTRTPGWTSA
ncbi:PAS domain-containing protein [Azospirillum brasilense]|uniref:PAS domain-containing protein n=1 Tax=Azospirillum brasilense TaxID=192 RepID=UPI0011788A3C